MISMTELLGPEGPFAREIPGFAARSGQQAMAEAIESAIADRSVLIVEAGTGTGKTFAYLAPALLSGKRVIISTGTKTLQDQLFHRDLPRVRAVLGARLKSSLLKGRANYLCRYRLDQAFKEGSYIDRDQVAQLNKIRVWVDHSSSGDRAELIEISEESPVWPRVTSTPDNCLGAECPFFDDCFVVKARRAAQEADVVVVNHHLLFADLAIKQEGFGELLPGAHAFILDEAHQIPELAGQFFSTNLTSRQLSELAQDAATECGAVSGTFALLQPYIEPVAPALRKLRLALDRYPVRGAQVALAGDGAVIDAMNALHEVLEALCGALQEQAPRSPGIESCAARALNLLERYQRIEAKNDAGSVHWYELSSHGFSFHATPLDLAPALRSLREQTHAAWIFTSATLSVDGRFEHFSRQLGLDDPIELNLTSPFDFKRQTLAYLPGGLPDPNDPQYTDRVIATALPVLQASQGRAFLLFTSHRALKRAAELLAGKLPYPLFVQGTAPRHQLLTEFRVAGNGVLLGAASFWEGVDVAGEALSCVIIDKLPFASPDDPVLQARLNALRDSGGNPFTDWQIPNAVISLKQGVGRLIRDIHDRGVLVLCDPRLSTRSYGKLFMRSLPSFPITRDIEDVKAFFSV